jgi:hypothetical protein
MFAGRQQTSATGRFQNWDGLSAAFLSSFEVTLWAVHLHLLRPSHWIFEHLSIYIFKDFPKVSQPTTCLKRPITVPTRAEAALLVATMLKIVSKLSVGIISAGYNDRRRCRSRKGV